VRNRLPLPGPVLWTAGVSLLAVLWMTFVMPMGDVLDEAEHAYRAYQLALGHLYPQFFSCSTHPMAQACTGQRGHLVPHLRVGGQLSAPLIHVLHRLFRESLTRQGTHFNPGSYAAFFNATLGGSTTLFAHFENTVLYSPVNYIPQTVVFFFGRALSAPVLATLFVARLVAGLAWMVLVTWSVALMRRWRWLWAMAVLVPTALAQGPSLSSDSIVFGLVAVALAYALRLAHAGEPLRRSQIARLAVLGLALGLLKFPIPLVVVAIVAIVWPLCGRGRARRGALAALVLPGLAGAVWWNATIDAYFLPYRNTVFNAPKRVNINQHAQLQHVLGHLFDAPSVLWKTLTRGKLIQVDGLVGTYGTHALAWWVAVVWLVLFGVLVLTCVEGAGPTPRTRAALAIVVVLCVLVTAFALYLTWNAVGASSIEGVQGRYFAPLLVLVIPLLTGLVRARARIPDWVVPVTVMTVSAAGALIVFESTAWSYYHQPAWQALPRVVSQLF
jgi:uncharacterized membrane protein